jgi:transcriptional regulator with XRE-family HTH domain
MNHDLSSLAHDRLQDPAKFRRTLLSMLELIEAEETSYADRKRAASTIRDALRLHESAEAFGTHLNQLELGVVSRNRTVDHDASELESQEAKFAERLKELMKAKSITQSQLASRIGCSQPAISQMLKRQCRPQRSTLLSLAAALDVEPRDLWPNLDVTDILDTIAAVQEGSEMTAAEADAIRRALEKPATKASARALPSRKK